MKKNLVNSKSWLILFSGIVRCRILFESDFLFLILLTRNKNLLMALKTLVLEKRIIKIEGGVLLCKG